MDESFDGSNDIKQEDLFLGDSLWYIDGKVLGSDEGIKLWSTDGKVLIIILVNIDIITIWIDVGTDMGSLDGPIYGSNDSNLEGILILNLLWCTDGKVIGSYEGIKLELSDGKAIGTILWNVDGTSLGIDVGTQ